MGEHDGDLTKVHIELPNHWWKRGESMWAKELGDDLFAIRNIPFCAYGLNFEDVVRATSDSPDLKPEIREVVARSGNQTLRVCFNVTGQPQQQCVDELEALGAGIERANSTFVCINVPPDVSVADVRRFLDDREVAGILAYETCEERVPGSFDDAPERDEGADVV